MDKIIKRNYPDFASRPDRPAETTNRKYLLLHVFRILFLLLCVGY